MKVKMSEDEKKLFILMYAFLFAGLMLGTFLDERIAELVYLPRNVFVTILTTIGQYPFAASGVMLFGAVFQRIVHGSSSDLKKIVLGGITVIAAMASGIAGAGPLLDADCMGGVYPSLDGNMTAIALIALFLEYPMFFLGYRLAERSDDRDLAKKAIAAFLMMFAGFLLMQGMKHFFCRPRYRTLVLGYEGINFIPWYTRFPDAAAMMAEYGLPSGEFRSFPSGHVVLASCVTIPLLLGSSCFESLRTKRRQLIAAGMIFAVFVMGTRLILGAHILNDVSAAGIIGYAFVLGYDRILKRMEERGTETPSR